MIQYFCDEFFNFIFKIKTLIRSTNLFLAHNFKKNDEVILNYFLKCNIILSSLNLRAAKEIFVQ